MDLRIEEKLRCGTLIEVHNALDALESVLPEGIPGALLDTLVEFTLKRLVKLHKKWRGAEIGESDIPLDAFIGAPADWIDEHALARKALTVMARIDPSLDSQNLDLKDPMILTAGGRLKRRLPEAMSKAGRSIESALVQLSRSINPQIAQPARTTLAKLVREHVVELLRDQYPFLAGNYGVKKLGIFGSYAKGHPDETSDVDIIVEFEYPIGFKFIELVEYLERLLGRKVDVLTPAGLQGIRMARVVRDIAESIVYV